MKTCQIAKVNFFQFEAIDLRFTVNTIEYYSVCFSEIRKTNK